MPVRVSKALIIADPWIGHILGGSKTWEMRSSGASHRGWFGLIRKGTGAVHGIARLVNVGTPLSPAEMIATFDRHCIPESMIRSGEVAKWNTPWKLSDVRRLARPVAYTHKSGAVTWVQLDEAAIQGIAAQVGGSLPAAAAGEGLASRRLTAPPRSARNDGESVRIDVRQRGKEIYIDVEWDDGKPRRTTAPERIAPAGPTPTAATPRPSEGNTIGEVTITDGNIANNHIYLRSFFDRFEADAVGGSNKASAARRELTIDWGGPECVVTDLDGSKKFFRARGWIGAFYRLNRAEAGDTVAVERIGPYRYRVRLTKGRSEERDRMAVRS